MYEPKYNEHNSVHVYRQLVLFFELTSENDSTDNLTDNLSSSIAGAI